MMQAGRIEVIIGPMFAGKTTELLRRIDRAELSHRRCVIIKYVKDQRYSADKVSTHDENMRSAIPCSELMLEVNKCLIFDTIGIDEGQFFPDLVEFCEKLANFGKTVIVAALDGTFQRKPFGRVLELISKCETITKLTAVCRETGDDAPFSKRIVNSKDVELIGGAESYVAASRSSFIGHKTNGKIDLTIGPVKSGKTTELIRMLNRYHIAGRRVVFLRSEKINDHHRPKFETRFISYLPKMEELNEYDVIGVDEAQMFDDIAEWADDAANGGKIVLVSGSEGDEQRRPFIGIINLFPLCEKVTKLDSICPLTGMPAPFSIIIDGINMIPISRLGILSSASLRQAMNGKF